MWRKIVTVESRIAAAFRFEEKEKAMIFQDERLRRLEQDVQALKETLIKGSR